MDNLLISPGLHRAALRHLGRKLAALRMVARWEALDLPPATEADRIAALKARAVPPAACGPDMPAAPARGPLVALPPMAMVRTEDGYDLQHSGWRGRDAARARDVFDAMADQARRAGGAAPFTPRQVAAGRLYAVLVERHSCVGLKGRSVEVQRGTVSAGRADGVMDRILDEGRRIARMRAAAAAAPGGGLALAVQRQRKAGRRAVAVADLVESVCLQGRALDHVLRAHGWACDAPARAQLQKALAAALDRMADTA